MNETIDICESFTSYPWDCSSYERNDSR